MVNGFETLLTQNVSALVMAGAFLFYLFRKDKMNKETYDNFNKTIQNHLSHALKVETGLTKALQKLSICISSLMVKNK